MINSVPDFNTSKLFGVTASFIEKTLPNTEASAAALIFQFLTAFGNCVGRSAFVQTEADYQHANIFMVLVGQSSKGRKGTAWGHIRRMFDQTDPEWLKNCVTSGLSSGEGLCSTLMQKDDEPPPDHRVMVVESEFAAVLKVQEREGNTLSAVVRNAWDTGYLNVLTRKDPIKVKDAHISIIGHVTSTELGRCLKINDMANGFGNRFLWPVVERSKLLPRGGNIHQVNFDDDVLTLRGALRFGRTTTKVERSPAAFDLWDSIYMELANEKPGVLGMMSARAEPQILRIALILALLDGSNVIHVRHLQLAYDLWKYCEESLVALFGESYGNPILNKIAAEVKAGSGMGLSRSEIYAKFGNHLKRDQLDTGIAELLKGGRFILRHQETDGRRIERLSAI